MAKESTKPGPVELPPEEEETKPEPVGKVVEGATPTDEERLKGYVRPHRDAMIHVRCKTVTLLRSDVADFHARSPNVIVKQRCSKCREELPAEEFTWQDGSKIGS